MPRTPPEPEAPFPRWAWALLAASLALDLGFALRRGGVFWPDEIFQSLEPAHRLAFGYGFVSWEFQLGARSWIFPGLLAAVLKLADLVSGGGPAALLMAAKVFMVLVAGAGLWGSLRLANALGGARAVGLAAAIGAAFPPQLIFSGRAMSEVASGAMLAWAAWLCLDRRRWHLRIAGALLALAIFLRAPNAVFAVVLAGALVIERRGGARPLLAGFAVMAALGGALDWITWGAPFHSVALAVRYNLVEGHAADYGRAPFGYYARALWTSTGPAILVIAAGLTRISRRARVPLAAAGAAIGVHLFLVHKELRFLAPFLPVLFPVAAAGLAAWLEVASARFGRLRATPMSIGLAALLAAAMIARTPSLTYADICSDNVPRPRAPGRRRGAPRRRPRHEGSGPGLTRSAPIGLWDGRDRPEGAPARPRAAEAAAARSESSASPDTRATCRAASSRRRRG
jgi:phosphatidylinositol glycan class B